MSYYIREATQDDMDRGLGELSLAPDLFDAKRNLHTITSRYFYPKSFVLVGLDQGKVVGVINLLIEKKINGDKEAHLSGLSTDQGVLLSIPLVKYAKDMALQDNCTRLTATCADEYVDAFRANDFTMTETLYASL